MPYTCIRCESKQRAIDDLWEQVNRAQLSMALILKQLGGECTITKQTMDDLEQGFVEASNDPETGDLKYFLKEGDIVHE